MILLQDGISHRQVPTSRVYTLSDDAVSKGANSSFPSLSYKDLLQMMFEADGVVVL